jgi:hypothetical protein
VWKGKKVRRNENEKKVKKYNDFGAEEIGKE